MTWSQSTKCGLINWRHNRWTVGVGGAQETDPVLILPRVKTVVPGPYRTQSSPPNKTYVISSLAESTMVTAPPRYVAPCACTIALSDASSTPDALWMTTLVLTDSGAGADRSVRAGAGAGISGHCARDEETVPSGHTKRVVVGTQLTRSQAHTSTSTIWKHECPTVTPTPC